jgi:hypothetical protein
VSLARAEPRQVSRPPQQRRPDTAQAGVTASANSPNGSWYRRAPAPGNLGAGGSGSRWKSTRSTLLSRPMTYRSMQSIVFIGGSLRSLLLPSWVNWAAPCRCLIWVPAAGRQGEGRRSETFVLVVLLLIEGRPPTPEEKLQNAPLKSRTAIPIPQNAVPVLPREAGRIIHVALRRICTMPRFPSGAP